jgi:adenylyltransferase/sulfurtransferase
MHRRSDVGAPKTAGAERAAGDLSDTRVVPVRERLTSENAVDLLAGADVVLDGSDTFETRESVAAACETLGVPLVWGTVQEFGAQVTVFWSRPPGAAGVVLRDLYPAGSGADAPACTDVGVLGSMCLQVGGLMATETIKLIAGIGEPLLGRVLVIDALRSRQREVPLLGSGASAAHRTAPRPARVPNHVSRTELAGALASGTAATVLDVREADELARGAIEGSLHVPLGEVLAAPAALAAGGPYVVVCQSGPRARRAAAALIAAGIDAGVLIGGMSAWDSRAARS